MQEDSIASRAISTGAGGPRPTSPLLQRITAWRWPDTLAFNLLIASVLGLLYASIVIGPSSFNPTNITWLTPDPAYHYIGWELFRQDPSWHWPLTYTDRVGYPLGESVALLDLNPLYAVLLKPFSFILSEPFQYLGLEVLLACILQIFFALRLARLIVGSNPLSVLLPSLFFVLSPPLAYRLVGHYSLSNHWLLLAALYIFLKPHFSVSARLRPFVISTLVLTGIAVGINPYLALQVLAVLSAGVAALGLTKQLTWKAAATVMAGIMLTSLAVVYSLGFFIPSGRGYSGGGYGFYSMNLLAPFDPYECGSILLPKLPLFTEGQYEGFNYLGLGAIALLACIAIRPRLLKPSRKTATFLLPLVLCCAVLTLMALSTKISLANRLLINLDPGDHLVRFLSPLRATGRLFWAPYYALLFAIVVLPFLIFRRSLANVIVGAALIVQIADTAPIRRWVYSTLQEQRPLPLQSPVWNTLGANHRNLLVMPAWQCDNSGSPGGLDGYRVFGYLATRQKMRTNSYGSARYNEASREFQCSTAIADLANRPLAPDTAYVVTPILAALIAEGPSGPGKCHAVDRFMLCSTKTDFGLGAGIDSGVELLNGAIRDAGFEENGLGPWVPYGQAQGATSAEPRHGGGRSLALSGGYGSVYQDVAGLTPHRQYTVVGWTSSSQASTATAQIAIFDPGVNVATFSQKSVPETGWQVVSHSITASSEGRLRIHLFRSEGQATVYWDDIRLYVDTPLPLNIAVRNSGFEDGRPDFWSTFQNVRGDVTSDRTYTGKYSLRETAGTGSLYQDISGLEPHGTYKVSAWVSGSANASALAQIATFDPAQNSATFSPASKAGNEWRRVTHMVTLGPKGDLRIHLFRNDGAGSIYWDDVQIQKDVLQAVMPNSGFETGSFGQWVSFQAVQAKVSSTMAHTGRYSLVETAGAGSVYQDVNGLQPGLEYKVSAWVAAPGKTAASVKFAVFDPKSNVATYSTPLSPARNWQKVDYIFKVTGPTARIHLLRDDATGWVYWDDIEVIHR